MRDFLYPFKFNSIFKEKVWGGTRLKALLNKNIPENTLIGESWELVDRGPDVSVIQNGFFANKTLRSTVKKIGSDLLGDRHTLDRWGRFPLLVKYLDVTGRLSVQVHPDDLFARRLNEHDPGKTELWYIIHAEPDAHIVYGCDPSLKKLDPAQGFNPSMEKLLHVTPVTAGDVVYLPPGQVHALLGGCVLLEIQQNSDVTYRLYDWDTVGLDGKPRELHVAKALSALKIHLIQDRFLNSNSITEPRKNMVTCDYFSVDFLRIAQKSSYTCDGTSYRILVPVAGSGTLSYGAHGKKQVSVQSGEVILLPAYLGEYVIVPEGEMQVISVC